VDEGLSDLIPGFLIHKRADIRAILEAVSQHDYETISRAAHRIKGEGGSYGFESMTEMGRSLEDAAKIHDDATVSKLARDLLNYLDRVEVVFTPSTE
jgi:HPt (histidine-containing phosphotransfer) domain-containing protein